MRIALIALAGAACYRGEPAPQRPVAPPSPPRQVRASADVLGFLPGDAQLVLHADMPRVRASTLWAKFEPQLRAKATATLGRVQALCGFDPLAVVDNLTLGVRALDTPDEEMTLVVRGIPRAQLAPCLPKVRAEAGAAMAFEYADARTLVVMAGPSAGLPQRVRDALEAGAPLRVTPFMELFARVDRSRPLWFVVHREPKLLSALGVNPQAVFGAIDLATGVAAKIVARMASANDAQTVMAMLQPQLPALQSLIAKLELVADDTDIVIDLAVTDDQLAMLAMLLGP